VNLSSVRTAVNKERDSQRAAGRSNLRAKV
jgi:hypothetical protein